VFVFPPTDQLYEFAGVEVRTTFKPSQKAVSPLAVITGTTGMFETILKGNEETVQLFWSVKITV
jgi:hypothetical protein